MVRLRQWIEDVEWTHGKVYRWNEEFADECTKLSGCALPSWLDMHAAKAKIGRMVLAYLGRVMDGEISGGIDESRDLAMQVLSLASSLQQAVVALEVSVRWMRSSHRII